MSITAWQLLQILPNAIRPNYMACSEALGEQGAEYSDRCR